MSRLSAFSLVEMTLVLLVLSILSASGLSLYQQQLSRGHIAETQNKLDAIQKALMDFSYTRHRLPCPADASIPDSVSDFGMEGQIAGVCDNLSPSSTARYVNIVAGAVPVRSLNLPDDYMYDSWGRRFTYLVDARVTEVNTLINNNLVTADLGSLKVVDASGGLRTDKAIYALISHGANGHGAYLSSGNRRNSRSTNTNELQNAWLDAAFADAPGETLVMRRTTIDPSDILNQFDDIVRYKESWTMVTAANQYWQAEDSPGAAPEPPPTDEYLAILDVTETQGCVITAAGKIYCWGQNLNGKIGIGTGAAEQTVPKSICTHADNPVYTHIELSSDHSSCALSDAGKIYCWGDNFDGAVGDGTNINRNVPTAVVAPAGVTFSNLVGGHGYHCALGSNGKGYCWGENLFGQLGNGVAGSKNVPTEVATPSGVSLTAIYASDEHACAQGDDDKFYCWGDNLDGKLGNGTYTSSNSPVVALLPAGVTAKTASQNENTTCVIGSDDLAYCWGENSRGEAGDGTKSDRNAPVLVDVPPGVVFESLTVGRWAEHSCAIATTGDAYCWGANHAGQVGDGTLVERGSPAVVNMPVGVKFTTLITHKEHSCALGDDGKSYCWGENSNGQLGDGTYTNRKSPKITSIPAGVNSVFIATYRLNACAVGDDDIVYCWGENGAYELGDGTRNDRPDAQPTSSLVEGGC